MKTSAIARIFCLVALCVLTGCAVRRPGITVSKFGDVDPAYEQKLADEAKGVTDVADVRVVAGSLPEGLLLEEQATKIIVLPEFTSKYEIIGSTSADYIKTYSVFRELFWTYEFEDWRKGFCYPQAPLKLLSLSLWNYQPLAWPCMTKIPSEESERKAALMDEMKKAVKAAGGNLLILSGSGSLTVNTYRNGSQVSSSFTPMISLNGFVVKEKR